MHRGDSWSSNRWSTLSLLCPCLAMESYLTFPSASTCTAKALDVFFFRPISWGNWATWISGKAPPSPKSCRSTQVFTTGVINVNSHFYIQYHDIIRNPQNQLQRNEKPLPILSGVLTLKLDVELAIDLFTSSARGTQLFLCPYWGGSLRDETRALEKDFWAWILSSASSWSWDSWVGEGRKLHTQ